jgi:hypothetical protein
MVLKQRRKVNRKVICGKGYCTCQSKKYVHGKGIMDVVALAMNFVKDNADTLKSTAEAIGNVVKIGDSTKTIVQEIMKKRKPKIQNSTQEDTYRISSIKSITLKWDLGLLTFSFLIKFS